jgi:hypothetical protein
MRSVIATLITFATVTIADAETINFDRDEVGKVPTGWTAGVTGAVRRNGWCKQIRLPPASQTY